MDEETRLQLIVEAVKYCQRVKRAGMPSSCYTKALREPIYFLWDCRAGGTKETRSHYRSPATVGLKIGDGQLVGDHAIPFKYLQSELLELDDVTPETVRGVLRKYEVRVWITKAEDRLLSAKKLRSKMPDAWNRTDPLARYKAAGIQLIENHSAMAKRRNR